MSLVFFYPETPNIEEESFRILNVFDVKISQIAWDAIEVEINQSLADVQSASTAIDSDLTALRKTLLKVRHTLLGLGV